MIALVIGYGSIGQRHVRILKEQLQLEVDIVTKQSLGNFRTYKSLDQVDNLALYDYFVIASETSRHFEQLTRLKEAVSGKNILVEKPLFGKEIEFVCTNNQIWIGYNLRLHPLLIKLKELLIGVNIFAVSVRVGEYLPWWRPKTDYRLSYSARRDLCGGVVRDISHEIDYIQWLFGNIVRTSSLLGHISDLEIETEDYASIIGITEHGVSISLVMDYLSTIPVRDMLIHASGGITIECNFETGILSSTTPDHNRSNWDFSQVDRDWTYREMHRAILFAGGVNCCMLEEGLSVMRTIEMIFKNNILELSDGT